MPESKGDEIRPGQAAKVINVYLKARLCVGPWLFHEKVQALHPPVDRLLLTALQKKDVAGLGEEWGRYASKGWSGFDDDDYSEVIALIRKILPGQPLWMIEKYWRGHQ